MVTINDVAKKAGVSIASVSYALNGKPMVSEATRMHIRKVAEELGYLPNSMATGLARSVTNLVGLIVPQITDTYTVTFIRFIEEEARNAGFYPILASTGGDPEIEEGLIRKLMSWKIDGCVVLPGNRFFAASYKKVLSLARKRGVPFIFANVRIPGLKTNSVAVDLENGQYRLARHLIDSGAKDIVFLGGKESDHYTELRLRGLARALRESFSERPGLSSGIGKSHIQGEISFEAGFRLVTDFIKSGSVLPDAVCAMNDSVALGALKAFRQQGISVPEDVLLTGFDNISLPAADGPKLTTMEIPVQKICSLCVDAVKNISADQDRVCEELLQTEFIKGDTA